MSAVLRLLDSSTSGRRDARSDPATFRPIVLIERDTLPPPLGRPRVESRPEVVLGFHSLCLVKSVDDDDMGSLYDDGSIGRWEAYLYEPLRGL